MSFYHVFSSFARLFHKKKCIFQIADYSIALPEKKREGSPPPYLKIQLAIQQANIQAYALLAVAKPSR